MTTTAHGIITRRDGATLIHVIDGEFRAEHGMKRQVRVTITEDGQLVPAERCGDSFTARIIKTDRHSNTIVEVTVAA